MSSLLLPDTGLLFWMVIIFAIVFALLARFGFPVIVDMVEKRKGYIDHSLKLAKEADDRIGALREEQSRIIEETRKEQNRILKEAADARDAILRQAQAKAKDEAARILAEAKVQIQAEKESAVGEIRAQVAVLSVNIAEKVIRTRLSTDQEQMELIGRMFDEASSADPQTQEPRRS